MIIFETGILLGLHRYEFENEKTKQLVQTSFLKIAQPSKTNKIYGMEDVKLTVSFAEHGMFMSQCKDLIGKPVSVECELTLHGRYNRRIAMSVKPAQLKQVA